jgi:ABC-type amino acid transport substrate-binding protein
MKKEVAFKKSAELRRVFLDLSEKWCRKHRLDLSDLAERCGVSLQYLSHISRYGRIPSKPILTLLALNLEIADPTELFRIAELSDQWPYDKGMGIRKAGAHESGLLSINLDMNGFADVVRDLIRSELQPKRFENLLGKRALRIGLNKGQFFLFDGKSEGFFPELIQALALSLHCKLEFVEINHADFSDQLARGKIDCYGPIYRTAPRLVSSLYSRPFCTVPIAAVGRTKKSPQLKELPNPKKISDLRKKNYIVAVHAESMAHHYAESVIGIPSERLILSEVADEALERVMLSNIPRPAHLMLTDKPMALKVLNKHASGLVSLFDDSDSEAPPYEDSIAVRPDWPELLTILDQSIEFMQRSGAMSRIFEKHAPQIIGVAV